VIEFPLQGTPKARETADMRGQSPVGCKPWLGKRPKPHDTKPYYCSLTAGKYLTDLDG